MKENWDAILITDFALSQHKAHSSMVSYLERRIDDLLKIKEYADDISYCIYLLLNGDRNLIKRFVEIAYEKSPAHAKEIVGSFHDEYYDLSTIECSKKDFKPWT